MTIEEWASQLKPGDRLVNFYCLNPKEEKTDYLRCAFGQEHVEFVSFDPETKLFKVKKGDKEFERERFFLTTCKCKE